MATKASNSGPKIVFGTRRKGKHSKRLNKHKSPSSKYKGQGK